MISTSFHTQLCLYLEPVIFNVIYQSFCLCPLEILELKLCWNWQKVIFAKNVVIVVKMIHSTNLMSTFCVGGNFFAAANTVLSVQFKLGSNIRNLKMKILEVFFLSFLCTATTSSTAAINISSEDILNCTNRISTCKNCLHRTCEARPFSSISGILA